MNLKLTFSIVVGLQNFKSKKNIKKKKKFSLDFKNFFKSSFL